jgi:hypothetical protein
MTPQNLAFRQALQLLNLSQEAHRPGGDLVQPHYRNTYTPSVTHYFASGHSGTTR